MAINGKQRKYLVKDSIKPIMIAYLVRKDDLEITNPLGRVLIRPYTNNKNETAYFVGLPYGFHDEAFLKTVEDIAYSITEKMNGGVHPGGKFELTENLYPDRSVVEHMYPKTMTAEAFLESLDMDYIRREDGTLVVPESLSLKNKNIKMLPDLSNVVFEKDFDVSFCHLETLDGMPRSCRDFTCIGNELKNLKGAPQTIA